MHDPNDKPQFGAILSGLFEIYEREPSEAQTQIWWYVFADVSIEDFARAVTSFIAEDREFMPKPGQVLSRATGEISKEDEATLAWHEVVKHIPLGCYKHVQFRNLVTNAAIRAEWGSWSSLCDRFAEGESQEHWLEKQFLRAYKALKSRGVGEEEAKPLAGLSQAQVVNGELVDPIPLLIGDPAPIAAIDSKPQLALPTP